jgi:hypothetical protein
VTSVLDHLAIGTRALAGGWELFGGLLGGTTPLHPRRGHASLLAKRLGLTVELAG